MGTTIRRPVAVEVMMPAVGRMRMRTGAAGRAKAKGKATTVTVGAMTTTAEGTVTTEIRAYDRCRSNRA
jgi:hypothetical protein